MRIEVARNTDCSGLDLNRLTGALEQEFGSQLSGTVSIAFVDNRQIADLNRDYLAHEGPTDVISFPLADDDDPDPENVLGEIVVSIEMARSESSARGIPLHEEVLRYCAHGLLHLLGHDDQTEEEAQKMTEEQERIVARHT